MLTTPMAAPRVEIRASDAGFRLYRDGQPYFIKGAGCSDSNDESLRRLVAAGGNSIRTWGADNLGELLDRAHKHGVTVTVGYWLGHVAHGFSYSNQKQVDEQFDKVRETVRKYRNHPAVLMWAMGNEMEINNDNDTLWKEVGRLAKMVKEEDPTRPVTTVIADINREKAERIMKFAPDLDLLGINSYGGLVSLPQRLTEYGWTKPYIVTEFGPRGPWELPKTPWGAGIEPTSTEKGKTYDESYTKGILADPKRCLGSYVFIWGYKQEETATWFGMMLPTGENLAAVDIMQRHWTGAWPKNRVPEIRLITPASGLVLAPGKPLDARVIALDPDGDPLKYEWVVKLESTDKKIGGYAEAAPPKVDGLIERNGGPAVSVKSPGAEGNFRVFLTVRDGKGGAATANIAFRVQP